MMKQIIRASYLRASRSCVSHPNTCLCFATKYGRCVTINATFIAHYLSHIHTNVWFCIKSATKNGRERRVICTKNQNNTMEGEKSQKHTDKLRRNSENMFNGYQWKGNRPKLTAFQRWFCTFVPVSHPIFRSSKEQLNCSTKRKVRRTNAKHFFYSCFEFAFS